MPHMEHFVKVYTSNSSHFGNSTTSRVEGSHSRIKSFLQNSTGDFLQVFHNISLSLEGQLTEVVTRIWWIPCFHMIEEKFNKFKSMEAPFKLSYVYHQWHLIVPSAMGKKTEDLNTEELAEQEFENFGSFFKQLPAFRRRELIGDFCKMCNGYYRLEPAGVKSVVPNPRASKTSTQRDMSCFEHERGKPMKAPLSSAPVKSYSLRTRSQNPPNPVPNSPFHTRGSSTRSSSFDGKIFQNIKDSPSKPLQELKDLYQSPYLKDESIESPLFQCRSKKEEDQDQKSKFGVERTSVKNLYQSLVVKASLSEYAASSSKEDSVPSNYSSCFGKPGSTTVGQPPASKENGFNLMVNELNKKTKYEKAKKESSSTGFGLTEEDQSKGIITISQKLNLMCPCYEQMDHIFGSLPNVNPLGGGDPKQHTWSLPETTNESTDEDMLPNLREAAPTPVNEEQLFRFPKKDEDIREGEDQNQPALNSDIITNDILVPPLATPINSSTSCKTSNSWNLNPNSHQKTSKSALPPTTCAEHYEAKTEHESDYESGRISREQEKWSKESELRMKQEEVKKEIEYKRLEYAKEEKYKDLIYAREEKEKDCELKLLLAEKEKEALKRNEDCGLLLAIVGSLRSLAEISEIAKILNIA
ncbi:hypothetical protein PPACK8108_LOCUS6651 [Phakopsora pachyrhizi]|uniref:Uncharacterized protein n=1 Tax=Phakopsora pachyrhizi TaxID=170000 RepID=A0AAV0AT68_PHAPC|nr:hypothetical protein PPACK8108_LOCUS6651 [Phakopsora pachyrhizi]